MELNYKLFSVQSRHTFLSCRSVLLLAASYLKVSSAVLVTRSMPWVVSVLDVAACREICHVVRACAFAPASPGNSRGNKFVTHERANCQLHTTRRGTSCCPVSRDEVANPGGGGRRSYSGWGGIVSSAIATVRERSVLCKQENLNISSVTLEVSAVMVKKHHGGRKLLYSPLDSRCVCLHESGQIKTHLSSTPNTNFSTALFTVQYASKQNEHLTLRKA